ncbi:DNA-directed RNA polymerase omega subunit [hydrothermal vent metagenome]|uniref:DNA-directed RNA polymerase n=1 Tax=hydrothermal vent metagenome TaxID=652676 RepID=A0A1W1CDB0_9ZZZZ
MRVEKITSQALKNVNFDRYLLATAVGKRAEELAKGAEPLVDVDLRRFKYADVALVEIAEGKISVDLEG